MLRAVIARAPTRLDFGGGWTDVPPYSEREGGAVCNAAITRYATATVSIGGETLAPGSTSALTDARLIRAALARAGRADASATVASDFPIGAGLGGSSAAGVALAGALAALEGKSFAPGELAERSRVTEVEGLGIAGGFQDHYAAAFGGALLLTFSQRTDVKQLPLAHGTAVALAQRTILIYTGESRTSGETIAAVLNAYAAGDRRVCAALARMKALAIEMAVAITNNDLDSLGALVGEHWVHQRALHSSITTQRIDAIVATAERAGALGVKALGASGGGCVLAIAAEGREEDLAIAVAPLGERLAYEFDTDGFQLISARDDLDAGATTKQA